MPPLPEFCPHWSVVVGTTSIHRLTNSLASSIDRSHALDGPGSNPTVGKKFLFFFFFFLLPFFFSFFFFLVSFFFSFLHPPISFFLSLFFFIFLPLSFFSSSSPSSIFLPQFCSPFFLSFPFPCFLFSLSPLYLFFTVSFDFCSLLFLFIFFSPSLAIKLKAKRNCVDPLPNLLLPWV